MDAPAPRPRYRAVFISDVHLGSRGCQAGPLLDFLRGLRCERLYLVGDIVDGWRLKRNWFWPQSHNDVLQKLLRLARKGVRVTYIPGNHDAFARSFCGARFGAVAVAREAVHLAADGRRYWVVHGDAFDAVIAPGGARALIAHFGYRALVRLNAAAAAVRTRLGLPYWSLAAFVKSRVRDAEAFIVRYEETLAAEAARRGYDGVICGHIHQARHRLIGGITYINDGDWVESCTAAVEHADGRMEVVGFGGAGDAGDHPASAVGDFISH